MNRTFAWRPGGRALGGLALASLIAGAAMLGEALAKPLLFLAAASTTDIMTKVTRSYERRHGGSKIRLSFAASSTLARQILNGVKADLFLSANARWMAVVAAKGFLAAGTRSNLLGNELVLLSSRRGERLRDPVGVANIRRLLAGRRLIIAEPAHVPLGMYTRQSLEGLGWWRQLAPATAFAPSARAVVKLILRTGNPGIAYASDLVLSARLHVLHRFADRLHDPIVYSVAVLKDRYSPGVKRYMGYLKGPEARAIYQQYNFKLLAAPTALPAKG